jgi:hypothetical protein
MTGEVIGKRAREEEEMQEDLGVLIELNERLGIAESMGDKDFLERALAPVLAFRRANGAYVDRSAFLKDVQPSSHRETEIQSITLLGRDRALVGCIVSLEVDGQRKQFHNVRLFVRAGQGDWQLLGWANEPQ